eukprot:4687719-Pyramimonas_sp.AAC.1
MDRCPLDSHCWAASYRDLGSAALWDLPGYTRSCSACALRLFGLRCDTVLCTRRVSTGACI